MRAALASILALALATPAVAVDAARMNAFLELARDRGCIIGDVDATLGSAGFAGDGPAIIDALVSDRKASRVGPALLVRGDACMEGAGPTKRERLMAVLGRGDNCARPTEGLYHAFEGYGLTRAEVDLMREEMEGQGELILSADGATLQLEPAQCARAQTLAREVTPHPEQAFLAFMGAHDCRMGKRDQAAEIAAAGLDPVATDIVIEKLVSEGSAIYYGPDESLIVFDQHCR